MKISLLLLLLFGCQGIEKLQTGPISEPEGPYFHPVLLGKMHVTSYRSVYAQTDKTPFITADGGFVHRHGVAASRDLLKRWGGHLDYGDHVFIEGYGIKVINDTMNKRHKNHFDIWVKSYREEKAIGWQKQRVWLIKTKEN